MWILNVIAGMILGVLGVFILCSLRIIDIVEEEEFPMEETKTVDTNTTLYELNKQLVEKNEPILTKEELEEKKNIVNSFIEETNNKYYMMLCYEQRDFTIFTIEEDKNNLSNVLVDECLINRGQVRVIDKTKDNNAIEIWITNNEGTYCYYFFPYDAAIVEV
jgi:hypothetical protein